MKISQSFIKTLRSYIEGNECGNLIKAWFVDSIESEPSEEMMLGIYFEFMLTGALPRSGKVPLPKMTKTGKSEPYARAEANAITVQDIWSKMGFVIAKDKEGRPLVGRTLTKGRYNGTIDVILEATRDIVLDDGFRIKQGERIIVDVKYTGLLGDAGKWNINGWAWTPESTRYHGTQAIQYHFIGELPFFFMPVSNKPKFDMKFFRVDVSEENIANHLSEGNDLMEKFEYLKTVGFEPRPEYSKCLDCQLREICTDKREYPSVETVVLNY